MDGRQRDLTKRSKHATRLTHGDTGSRLYGIWNSMKQRTSNPNAINYSLYGGKGIHVCKDWEKYESFKNWSLKNGYESNLTLDRIDGNLDYSPDNCRWASWEQQENNRCNNHVISFDGKTMTLSQWARAIGIHPKTLSRRIVDKGWSVEKALTTPLLKTYKRRDNYGENCKETCR